MFVNVDTSLPLPFAFTFAFGDFFFFFHTTEIFGTALPCCHGMVSRSEKPGENRANNWTVAVVLGSTTSGTLVLLLCLVAIFVSWAVSTSSTSLALETVSKEFRHMQENFLAEALADMIRPLWRTPTQWSRHLATGLSLDGYPIMPPTVDMLQDLAHAEKVVAFIAPTTDKNLFLRGAAETEANRTYFTDVTAAVNLCLNENLSLSSACSHAGFLSVSLRDSNGTIRHVVMRQYVDDGQNTLADSTGMAAQVHLWDMDLNMLIPFVNFDIAPLPPSLTLGGLEFPFSSPWSNFTYMMFPGGASGVNLIGATPIMLHGQQVGFMSYMISLSLMLVPVLQEALESGGDVTKNAFLAVYAADGTVIGLSEDAAGGGGALMIHASVETIPGSSYTKKAIEFLKREHGDICPVAGHLNLDEEEDRLVDVMPFYTEDWGLPSLGTRWCQVLTVPRDNLYGSIDEAERTSLIVGLIAGGGFTVALCLLSLSVWQVCRTNRNLRRRRRAADYALVLQAVEEVGNLGCPMALIGAGDFLELEELVCYEDVRDAGKLVVLDSLDQIHSFRERNRIVFFSHQWLGWLKPDDAQRSQLRAMQAAVRTLQKAFGSQTVYVWVDYICVSQRHSKAQWMAVSSLPVYVSMVDIFIIIAPDATHRDTQALCGLSTYTRRGWCRLEMLAKACGSGFQHMYSVEGSGTSLRRLSQQDFEHLSLNVFRR